MEIQILSQGLEKPISDDIHKLLNTLSYSVLDIEVSSTLKNKQVTFITNSNATEEILSKIEHYILVCSKEDSVDKALFEDGLCLGVYFSDKSQEDNYLNIKNALDGVVAIETQKKLLTKLNGVMEGLVGQLQDVKSLHQNVAPYRNEKIRGINISSRFCAGMSSGGEFFDFFKIGSDVWITSLYASSYIIIGNFLTMIEEWKSRSSITIEDIEAALNNSKSDFEELGASSFFAMKVSLNDLTYESFNIGEHELLDSDKVHVQRNQYSFPQNYIITRDSGKLEKGGAMLMLSPGFFKNGNETIDEKTYHQFIRDNWNESSELISELTFQSKKRYSKQDFLPNDQTVLIIEVDKNAISKL